MRPGAASRLRGAPPHCTGPATPQHRGVLVPLPQQVHRNEPCFAALDDLAAAEHAQRRLLGRARDVVAQHFALATTAHMAQWMLSGLEVNPSLAIARMRVLMTDQTTPALGRLAK